MLTEDTHNRKKKKEVKSGRQTNDTYVYNLCVCICRISDPVSVLLYKLKLKSMAKSVECAITCEWICDKKYAIRRKTERIAIPLTPFVLFAFCVSAHKPIAVRYHAAIHTWRCRWRRRRRCCRRRRRLRCTNTPYCQKCCCCFCCFCCSSWNQCYDTNIKRRRRRRRRKTPSGDLL